MLKILGINITPLNSYKETYDKLISSLDTVTNPAFVTVNNVHTVIEAVRSNKYRKVLNSSVLALPDGKPLSIIAKLKGDKNINRIFGPTFMEKTFEILGKPPYTLKDGVQETIEWLRKHHPNLVKI